LKQKRISATIPNAGSGVAEPRIYLHPPSQHTGTACAVMLTHKTYASTALVLLPSFLTVILFVAMQQSHLAHCLFHFVP